MKRWSLVVLFALLASLVLAITFMPAVATFIFKRGVTQRETWVLSRIRRMYEPALVFAVRFSTETEAEERKTLEQALATRGSTAVAPAGFAAAD